MFYALTLAALACGGGPAEPVADLVYSAGTLRVPTPAISPAAGSYANSVTVSVSNLAAGETTYCAVNANPQRSAAQRYVAPFGVTVTSEIRCQSFTLDGRQKSRIASAAYTITTGSPPAVASCASESLRATGTTYYYCECGTGADPNCQAGTGNGLSASTPAGSGYRSRLNGMAGGSTVALCRGGSFLGGGGGDGNSSCSAGATCDLRDYTDPRFTLTAGERRPIIYGGRVLMLYSSTAYSGFRVFNLQSIGSLTGQGAVMTSGPQTDIDVCNVRFSGGDIAVYTNGDLGYASRVKVRQSQFYSMSNSSLLGSASEYQITDNYFANTATGTTMFTHGIYMGGSSTVPLTNVRIANNEIHACPVGASSLDGSAVIVSHGQKSDMVIENNYIECDNPTGTSGGWYAIGIGTGYYSTTEGFIRPVIRGNRIVNMHYYGIALSQSVDALIENNIIVLPPNVGASYGIILNEAAPDSGDTAGSGGTVRNNTVYVQSSSNPSASGGVAIWREGTGYTVTNNAVYYQTPATSKCFDLPLSSGAYAVANNACNGTWGTAYGTGAVVLGGSPFVSVGSDFTPALGSLILNSGTLTSYAPTAPASVTWSATDAGKNRDASPDIGAMER